MAPSRGPHDNADGSRRLSVIASRLSGLCFSNHGLAPVANEFHAFGTVCPRCEGAGLALRKSFTVLASSLSCRKRQASSRLEAYPIFLRYRAGQSAQATKFCRKIALLGKKKLPCDADSYWNQSHPIAKTRCFSETSQLQGYLDPDFPSMQLISTGINAAKTAASGRPVTMLSFVHPAPND